MSIKDLIPGRRDIGVPVPQSEAFPFLTLHRQMNRLFDDFLRDFDTPLPAKLDVTANWPRLDVEETDKEVKVVAELPGLDEKDIDITLRDGLLTIKGERKAETRTKVYSEIWQGQFMRQVELGADVDPDKVKANFDKGVLTVAVAKKPEAQSQVKRITINGK